MNVNNIQWGDIGTWIGSVGTVLAFIAAFYQINIERKARKQSEQLQQKQLMKSQAEHISAWVDKEEQNRKGEKGPTAVIAVLNQSSEPVYQIIVSIVAFQGAGPGEGVNTSDGYRGFLSVVPPQSKVLVEVSGGYRGMSFHPAVEIVFVDIHNHPWVRKGNGDLLPIKESPMDYYKIPQPHSWQLPRTTEALV